MGGKIARPAPDILLVQYFLLFGADVIYQGTFSFYIHCHGEDAQLG